jgi:hypothetical protein
MTTNIPRQLVSKLFEGQDLLHIDARITALEGHTTVPDNVFFTRHFGTRDLFATQLKSLHNRVAGLEASSPKPVHLSLRYLARRTPLGATLFSLHSRLVALGG